ncbi:MAG: hypothetical protein FWC75_05085 [Oscillospiraceae bacterium]|nr:hypothetical protein [Oscillospiraceae bacterium]
MKLFIRIVALILILGMFSFAAAIATEPNGDTGEGDTTNNGDGSGCTNGSGANDNGDDNGNGGNGSNGGGTNGGGTNGGGGQGDINDQHQRELAYWIARVQQLERELDRIREDPIAPPPRRPLIHVTDPLWIEMDAGTRRTVNFTIRNMGADGAQSIVTTADMSDALGITGVFMDAHHSINTLGARAERTFSFQITVNETVSEGFHRITFNHEYLNARNERITSVSHVTVRVLNRAGSVSIRNIASNPSRVSPGTDFNISAAIHNDSAATIRDVSMSITSGMASDGIFLRDSTSIVSMPNMSAGQIENISIGFTSAQRARSGAYPLGLELSFIDGSGERQTQRQTFFVNVTAETEQDEAADVIITNISRPSGAMRVGQEFEMVVTLQNTGEYSARNIRVDATTDANNAIVPRSTSRMQVSRLEPGAETSISFRFAPTATSTTRSYDIGFVVNYDSGIENADGDMNTVTFTQFQGVNVFNPEPDDDNGDRDDPARISTPRIIVSDFRSTPMIVQAGQEFDLEISFMNTSSDRTIRNIRVTLSVEEEVTTGTERRGSVFTPVGRSSTFFIDVIAPRDEVVEHIRFFTLPDAPPRNYVINVNFEYEDIDNNPFEARDRIGINVAQVTRLDTSEIFIPDSAAAFSPIFFSFELYNTGRVTLSNLMIRTEGNFMINQSSMFFGTLNPGSMDFFDNTITPMESGRQQLAIIMTYEDDSGELIEERKEFYIDVFEMDFGSGMDMMRPPFGDGDYVWDPELGMFVPASEAGLGLWAIIGIIAGALIVAGIVVLIIVRRRKKMRERLEAFDE